MIKIGKIIFLIILAGLLVLSVGVRSASAQATSKPIVNVDFPCPSGLGLGNCQPSTDIPSYLNNLYRFAVGISGLLALGMIVAGGVYYTVSAGNSGRQTEARSMIVSALWGLALLFGSYLVLRTVNPQITTLGIGFVDTSGREIEPISTTSTLAGESVQINKCRDFKDIPIANNNSGFDSPTPTCESRKNITKNNLKIAPTNFYDGSYEVKAGSVVWVYPYFPQGDINQQACLIYAYRESNASTTLVSLKEDLRLCYPQKQKQGFSCTEWVFTGRGTSKNPSSAGFIESYTPFSYTVSVNKQDFDYTNPSNPPPGTGNASDKSPVPGYNLCCGTHGCKGGGTSGPLYCSDKSWTCTKFKN